MLQATTKTGHPISQGDTIADFRGQHWTFQYPTRAEGNGRTGKVCVSDELGQREFYQTVFGLVVRDTDVPRTAARADAASQRPRPDSTFFIQVFTEDVPGYTPTGSYSTLQQAQRAARLFNAERSISEDLALSLYITSLNANR